MDTPTITLEDRLDAISEQLAWLVAKQEKQEELWTELMPIAKEMLTSFSNRLDGYERQGYFAFGQALLEVGQKVVQNYSADDVHKLGDAVVTILDGVRAVTQPEVMRLATDAAQVVAQIDRTEPVGLFGVVRATRDEDVQRAIAVLLEVLRKVGHGVKAMGERQTQTDDRRARLAAVLGPKRGRTVLGVERAPVAPPPPRAAPAAATPVMVEGVKFTPDGHLADATAWTKPMAETLATAQGVKLTDAHWKVLEAARADFASAQASPNIRRLTQVANVTTKDLYALFPRAPGRTIAKIAGLPKPAGCL
jgi:TusE/DsrC/DsvC family sulfur relay protein